MFSQDLTDSFWIDSGVIRQVLSTNILDNSTVWKLVAFLCQLYYAAYVFDFHKRQGKPWKVLQLGIFPFSK